MPSYSEERKAAVLKKMLPPHNQSVAEVSREEGIRINGVRVNDFTSMAASGPECVKTKIAI